MVRIVLSAQSVVGGTLKLTADPAMVVMVDDIGAGQGLRLFVGACEVAGAVGVLIPPLTRLAAAGLAGLMVGAAITNVVVLQISPRGPAGPAQPDRPGGGHPYLPEVECTVSTNEPSTLGRPRCGRWTGWSPPGR